jgi:uncharacterized protein (DUF58 family)
MKNMQDVSELVPFGNIELAARLVVEGFITGLHKSPFHGFSVEFAEHRQYNSGESIKNIDWKLFGRTEKLYVKRFEEETNLRSQIIIDTSSSMYFPYQQKLQTKLAFSAYTAAALIHLLQKQRDAVGLTFYSDKIHLQTDTKMSSVHTKFLYQNLGNLLENQTILDKKTDTAAILHQIADKIHKRSLVMIFSDMYSEKGIDNLLEALQHFRYNKHELVLFHVMDRNKEEQFDYQNRPYKFVDMESGEILKLNPSEIREHFSTSSKNYNESLRINCAKFEIDYVPADINTNFSNVLIAYLLKRKRMA